MGTKNNPGKFDCLGNAEDDEPVFILLGRDRAAADTVRYWAQRRIELGLNSARDEQIIEAGDCAAAIDTFARNRKQHRDLRAAPVEEPQPQALLPLQEVCLACNKAIDAGEYYASVALPAGGFAPVHPACLEKGTSKP